MPTLTYLQKGGRIGRVAGMAGTLLNIKPIISCDDDGIYYPVAKVRGEKKNIVENEEATSRNYRQRATL